MKQMVYLGADPDFVSSVAGDEQRARLAALAGRPSSSDPEQASTMPREKVLARAPFPAQPLAAMPVPAMFGGDYQDLRVGFTRQDDRELFQRAPSRRIEGIRADGYGRNAPP